MKSPTRSSPRSGFNCGSINSIIPRLTVLFALATLVISCANDDVSLSVQIVGENIDQWSEAPVAIEWSDTGIATSGHVVVMSGQREIASQIDDLDGDGQPDELFVLLDLKSDGASKITISHADSAPSYIPRTQAVLAVRQGGRFDDEGLYVDGSDYASTTYVDVPAEQEQDSKWAMLEGPVWESDLVGFRYYLDDRYRTDIFGKRTPGLILHTDPKDYHSIGDWGADILKVGTSLGLGSPAVVIDNIVSVIDNAASRTVEVVASGPLRSILRTTHRGWEISGVTVDVVSEMEIHAGQRWTEQRLMTKGLPDDARLATGIVRHPAAAELHTGEIDGVHYLYTWGKQSFHDQNLGMALLVQGKFDPIVVHSDPESHVVTFQQVNGGATYRFLAAWELEPNPIQDQDAFDSEVRRIASQWATDIEVIPK